MTIPDNHTDDNNTKPDRVTTTSYKVVSCPNCQQEVPWSAASPHRPFCSERCKQMDFGDWAAERHVIPGQPVFPAAPDTDDEMLH